MRENFFFLLNNPQAYDIMNLSYTDKKETKQMIYITGDLHGCFDIAKLREDNFTEQAKLTRGDYLIICGDFGLVWDFSDMELYWRGWLEKRPWTTLWVDGNHENFGRLSEFPETDWKGGKIQKITDHVYHLCRGYVFNIDGKKIFAFGGAESHDKEFRTKGISIWDEELPTEEEMERGRRSLAAEKYKVDIVITHSLPTSQQARNLRGNEYPRNILTDYFDEISAKLDYKLWFSGHYHRWKDCGKRQYMIYDDIVKLNGKDFEFV